MKVKRKTSNINVRVSKEVKELLERITTRENISQANLKEHLLRAYEDKGGRFTFEEIQSQRMISF